MKTHSPSVELQSASVVEQKKSNKVEEIEHVATLCERAFFSPGFFKRLKRHYGGKFLFFLTDNYLLLKGATKASLQSVPVVHFKALKLDSQIQTRNRTFIEIPWSIKGIIGAFSDIFPMFGYYKRSHMFMYALISTLSSILVAISPNASLFTGTPGLLHVLYLGMMLSSSALDLLCEGKYTQIMIEHPDTRSDIVSFIWFIQSAGSILVGLYLGPILDSTGTTPIFWSIFAFNLQILILISFNFVAEKPCPSYLKNKIDIPKIVEMGPFFLVAAFMGIWLTGSAFAGVLGDSLFNMIYSLTLATVMTLVSYVVLPWRIANCNIFLMLTSALYPSFGAPLENWYVADAACVPGGPNFSQTYFQTVNLIVGNVASAVAIVIFQTFMSHWSLRTLYWTSALLLAIASFNDYLILLRWNINYLGIPDTYMYIIGDGIVANICYMLNFLPPCILLSRMCPKNIESTAFAILAGYSNMGNIISNTMGQYIQERLNINFHNDICTYSALPNALLISSTVMYILSIPISFWLIPPYKASDPSRLTDIGIESSLYYILKQKYIKYKQPNTSTVLPTIEVNAHPNSIEISHTDQDEKYPPGKSVCIG